VLMGGPMAEHDVSLQTGTVVINALDRDRFRVKPIRITRDGQWLVPRGYLPSDGEPLPLPPPPEPPREHNVVELACHEGLAALCSENAEAPVDAVFIAMHGPYGEDGTIQGMLEVLGVPYTGSGVLASALAMHKTKSRRLFEHHGLLVPPAVELSAKAAQEETDRLVTEALREPGIPCVVKPASQGSSFGVTICRSADELQPAVARAFEYDGEVLIEEYLEGTELTCAVLEQPDGTATPLPVIEIVPKTSEFFDFNAKYEPGATDEICPARISPEHTAEAQRIALTAHEALGCSGLTRADMMLYEGRVYLFEVNTIPGLTPTSLAPQAAEAVGISFPELVERMIDCGLLRGQSRDR